MSEKKFAVEYAKRGTAGCKKCKSKIEKGILRIGKVMANPFSDNGGDMKQWHHVECLFQTFAKARATTKVIEEPEDMDGWEDVAAEDRKQILQLISDVVSSRANTKPKANNPSPSKAPQSPIPPARANPVEPPQNSRGEDFDEAHVDSSFRQFRRICAMIAEEPGYKNKSEILSQFFQKGASKNGSDDGFQSDLHLWTKLLLPGIVKRVYNLQSKQLVKVFSVILSVSLEEMVEDLENGDVAETALTFFEKSTLLRPAKKSTLSLWDVDRYLDQLSRMSKEEKQQILLRQVARRCTANDLKMFVRLIKGDLRINAGAKHILDAVHPDAYSAFQSSRDLADVLQRAREVTSDQGSSSTSSLLASITLMTPVLPMLAEACKSIEFAMKRCPNGMFAEIKYDGERLQLHKRGSEFKFFSRSLKPVLPHKVNHLKEFVPKAFIGADDLILDAEILLVDTETNQPLPFGTLGVHKKAAFQKANVCLFVFDCLMLNGQNLMSTPIQRRKELLKKQMKEIPNRIMLSEARIIHRADDLKEMVASVLGEGLEGLVMKDLLSVYEPGKRHWLKLKKDYLDGGSMADSADLVVLGAWFGTGSKGGMMSIFLMGCRDDGAAGDRWRTVTKVHGGHDDATLARLQDELEMVKISRDVSRVPSWLSCSRSMVPDFVSRDPRAAPVWEISGAEFTRHEVHTAGGISIRFPRVTRIRDDKDWRSSTTLSELHTLYTNSRRSAPNGSRATDVSPAKRPKLAAADSSPNAVPPAATGLPSILRSVRAVISADVTDRQKLRRYIMAYDGQVLQDYQLSNATHYITIEGSTGTPSSPSRRSTPLRRVASRWIWDAIRRGSMPPERLYAV